VQHAMLVRVIEGIGDLLREGERLLRRHGARRDPVGQRLPLDQLHHERPRARGPGVERGYLFETVQRGDVRVSQAGENLGFALEPRPAFRVCRQLIGQDLERHIPFEAAVASAIHLAHSARAKGGGDLVGAEPSARGQGHRRRGLSPIQRLLGFAAFKDSGPTAAYNPRRRPRCLTIAREVTS
jgi:hypothetical protein